MKMDKAIETLVAFLCVSGLEKDGRVQFVVRDSNMYKELEANSNYEEVKYNSNIVLSIVVEEEASNGN